MRLTERQASVYRFVRDEEIEYGETPAAASMTAYRFMRDDALPDWRAFWADWNRKTPTELEQFIRAGATVMIVHAMVQNAAAVGGLLDRANSAVAGALRAAVGE